MATFRIGFLSDVSDPIFFQSSKNPIKSAPKSRAPISSGLKPLRFMNWNVCASFRSIWVVSGTGGNNILPFYCIQTEGRHLGTKTPENFDLPSAATLAQCACGYACALCGRSMHTVMLRSSSDVVHAINVACWEEMRRSCIAMHHCV